MAPNNNKCPNCGKFIRNNVPFCIHCGTQLKQIETDEEGGDKNNGLKENSGESRSTLLVEESNESMKKNNTISSTTLETPKSIAKSDEKFNEQNMEIEELIEDTADNETDQSYIDNKGTELISEEEIAETVDELMDDDDAFATIMEGKSLNIEDSEKPTGTKENKKLSFAGAADTIGLIHESKKKTIDKIKQKKSADYATTESQPAKQNIKRKPKYNPAEDGYYDNVQAAVDARIEHIKRESIISTVGLVVAFILIIVFMVYFVVL